MRRILTTGALALLWTLPASAEPLAEYLAMQAARPAPTAMPAQPTVQTGLVPFLPQNTARWSADQPVVVHQSSSTNLVDVVQISAAPAARITQSGQTNAALVVQIGGGAASAQVTQRGGSNATLVSQNAARNAADVQQLGGLNAAQIVQTGQVNMLVSHQMSAGRMVDTVGLR